MVGEPPHGAALGVVVGLHPATKFHDGLQTTIVVEASASGEISVSFEATSSQVEHALAILRSESRSRTKIQRDGNDLMLSKVRGLGFDVAMSPRGTEERIFFIGPDGQRGAHASTEAIREFIDHLEYQIDTVTWYLGNGRNNKTHEWLDYKAKPPRDEANGDF